MLLKNTMNDPNENTIMVENWYIKKTKRWNNLPKKILKDTLGFFFNYGYYLEKTKEEILLWVIQSFLGKNPKEIIGHIN